MPPRVAPTVRTRMEEKVSVKAVIVVSSVVVKVTASIEVVKRVRHSEVVVHFIYGSGETAKSERAG